MVWDMITPDREWSVTKMDGKIDTDECIKAIQDPLNKPDDKFGRGNYHFQQDNVATHVSKPSLDIQSMAGI